MKSNKKLCFIAICVLLTSLSILSLPGSDKEDFYKKNFVVDRKKNNVEDFIKPDEEKKIRNVFFAPNDDILGLFLGLMKKEQSRIKMTVYSLRDAQIKKAIFDALKRGIKMEIVFDSKFEEDRREKILMELEKRGAKVFVFKPPEKPHKDVTGIMHNKYIIFEKNIYGKTLLWSGSCNLTSTSHRLNQENVFVCDAEYLIKEYADDFEDLKTKFCYPYGEGDDDYVLDSQEWRAGERRSGRVKDKIKLKGNGSGKRKRKVFEWQDKVGKVGDEPPKKRRKVEHKKIAKAIVANRGASGAYQNMGRTL